MKYLTLGFVLIFTLAIGACSTPQLKFTKEAETVVLLHGYGRSNFATENLAEKINKAGYNVVPIEYESINQNIDELKQEIIRKIDACCSRKAEKIHFVGHSMGGLLIRYYLDKRRIDNLGKVVLMGTPNKGTPVVDLYKDKWWFGVLGESVMVLSSKKSPFLDSLQKPYYPLGVIAGSVKSVFMSDVIEGKSDGLIPVYSTVLPGMTDFVLLNVNHGRMRSSDVVASQILSFLDNAKFE